MTDETKLKELEDEICSWYWARNGPSPRQACTVMLYFVLHAEPRACVREGAALKRGQIRFVARDICGRDKVDMSEQTFKTILARLISMKLIVKGHQTNKKATIITICNFNNYRPAAKRTNVNPTRNQRESNLNLTNLKGTHDNNIINNNDKDKVEAENYYLDSQRRGGAPARASRRSSGGELPIYSEIAEIANDRPWLEAVAMNNHRQSVEEIMPMFALFRNECLASGKTRHDSIADCKSHFNNWYRLQLQRKAEDGKRKNEYPTREEQTETSLEALRMLDEVRQP